jgi:hypothetical protein
MKFSFAMYHHTCRIFCMATVWKRFRVVASSVICITFVVGVSILFHDVVDGTHAWYNHVSGGQI